MCARSKRCGHIAFVIACSCSCEDPRTRLSFSAWFFLPMKNSAWPPRRQGRTLSPTQKELHMTSTPCQNAALDRIIALWAAKIALLFRTIVENIVTIAALVRTSLHQLASCCRKAGQRLPILRAGLFCMMPKLEAVRRDASCWAAGWASCGLRRARSKTISNGGERGSRQPRNRSRRLLVRAAAQSGEHHRRNVAGLEPARRGQ